MLATISFNLGNGGLKTGGPELLVWWVKCSYYKL